MIYSKYISIEISTNKLFFNCNLDCNGKLDGDFIHYDYDGNIIEHFIMKNGKLYNYLFGNNLHEILTYSSIS